MMYIIIYSFKVKPGKELDFEKAWLELTKLIYQYEGSLGSRLHKESDLHYIAYAQWPSKDVFDNSGNCMPEEADKWRALMINSCESKQVLYQMQMKEDYLQKQIFVKM